MNSSEIVSGMENVNAQLTDKGFQRVSSDMRVSDEGRWSLQVSYKDVTAEDDYSKEYKYFNASDVAGVFTEARIFIEGLASPEELRKAAFLKLMGKCIELGKEYGIDTEFTNPLVVAMKKLSENALTGPAGAQQGLAPTLEAEADWTVPAEFIEGADEETDENGKFIDAVYVRAQLERDGVVVGSRMDNGDLWTEYCKWWNSNVGYDFRTWVKNIID